MVRIVQCLCPARHCIAAIAYDPGATAAQADFGSCDYITLTEANAAEYLRGIVEGLIQQKSIDPWCGICGSRDFIYEDRRSIFKTMDEALPELERGAENQRQSRELIDELKSRAGRN